VSSSSSSSSSPSSSLITGFLSPDTFHLEPMVHRIKLASSFRLYQFSYYVRFFKYRCFCMESTECLSGIISLYYYYYYYYYYLKLEHLCVCLCMYVYVYMYVCMFVRMLELCLYNQLVKIFPAFYGTRRSIIVFIRAPQLVPILSQMNPFHPFLVLCFTVHRSVYQNIRLWQHFFG
jgi:hypothetical protein